MKHFPSGDTLSKYQSQKVRKPRTTKQRRSQVYKTNDKTKAHFRNPTCIIVTVFSKELNLCRAKTVQLVNTQMS